MGGVEIGGRWESYLERNSDTAAQAAARKAEREGMEARKAAAQAKAEAIIARVGTYERRHPISQEQRTRLIPLGPLGVADGVGRSHGFASVYLYRDLEPHEEVTKGRFFKKVETVYEVSNTVSRFGVMLYAGKADSSVDGSDVLCFDAAGWSITQRGWETDEEMTKLESFLEVATGALSD